MHTEQVEISAARQVPLGLKWIGSVQSKGPAILREPWCQTVWSHRGAIKSVSETQVVIQTIIILEHGMEIEINKT